jgi:hypothetical protein
MRQSPFVFVPLHGGLGNQMFQYSAGFIVAKLNHAQLYLQNSNENAHNKKNHNYVKLLFQDASECHVPPKGVLLYRQAKSPFCSWNPVGLSLPCHLEGYFQYYPVLEPFLYQLIERFRQALRVKQTTDTVFLHIRRGDYVEKSKIHYLQSAQYYYAAYKHLNKILRALPPNVLVFSDDIEWCKKQDWIQKIPNVSFYENEDELETLAEMASCGGGAIIANSTFSWWGAILSKTKYVYYPSKWIAMPIENLFPKHWVCI